MNKTKVTVKSTKGNSTLVRARFGPGMLLHHEDLDQITSFTRELSRMMFSSFFGCGVVCGLRVKPEAKGAKLRISVGAGLALNCSGDPVYLPNEQQIWVGDDCDDIPEKLWVVLCGTMKRCAPRAAECPSDEDEPSSVCTRERDGYEIRVLREAPKSVCGYTEPTQWTPTPCKCVDPELPCYKDHYAGECGCKCGDCSDGDCNCIILARLDKPKDNDHPWTVDHRVRRFIRPVLMRDPIVEDEEKKRKPDGHQDTQEANLPGTVVAYVAPGEGLTEVATAQAVDQQDLVEPPETPEVQKPKRQGRRRNGEENTEPASS